MFETFAKMMIFASNVVGRLVGDASEVLDNSIQASNLGYGKWIIIGGVIAACIVTVMTLKSED